MKRNRLPSLIFCLTTLLFSGLVTDGPKASAQRLRMVCYNMLDGPVTTVDDANMRVVLQAIGDSEIMGVAQPIDILAFQEGPESAGQYPDIIANMEAVFGGDFASSITPPDFPGGCRTGFIYNRERVELLSAITLSAGLTHNTRRGLFRPVGGSEQDEFYMYSIHLDAGFSDMASRAVEATIIRNNADGLPDDAQIIYCGDFNIIGSVEVAFQNLFAPGDNASAVDTLNTPFGFRDNVTWQENTTFLPFHTQDPTGNMDDRFDAFYINDSVVDGENFEYVKGSCTVLGNNATHFLNTSINTGSGTAGFGSELIAFSDHLPVICDFTFGQSSPEFTGQLSIDATSTHFVRSTGPVAGAAGTADIEVEGTSNGAFASFAVIDFDLADQLSEGDAVDTTANAVLNMVQDNEFFTDGGSVAIYLASEAAAQVAIDDSIVYQAGQNGIGSVPESLSAGAIKLATYASVHEIDGADLPDGTEDPIALFGESIDQAIASSLNNGTTLRLLIVPVLGSTAATYTGFSTALTPPSLSVDLVVDDGTIDLLADSFSLSNGANGGGQPPSINESNDARVSFFSSPVDSEAGVPIQVVFTGELPGDPLTSLTVCVESLANAPNLELFVESLDFQSNEFVQFGAAAAANLEDGVSLFVAPGDLERFRGPNNLIFTRVSWRQTGPTLFFPWKVGIDQFKWTLTQ